MALAHLIDHEMIERREQIGPEASLRGFRASERIVTQQSREEILGEVLGIVRADAPAADLGINRPPVDCAKLIQRGIRLVGPRARRPRHKTPARCVEPRAVGLGIRWIGSCHKL
jgi:hypothetical protein